MELTGFRVQMYRCIIDSGWVEIDPLTVLVGKNESGKTALLTALHKFNPFSPDPYSIPDEWPRGLRDKRSEKQVVCTAEFALSPQEQEELAKITDQEMDVDRLKVSKDYAGYFEVEFPEDVFPERLHPNSIDEICASLPNVPDPVNPPFKEVAETCKQKAMRLAREARFSELAEFHAEATQRLGSVRTDMQGSPPHANEDTFINQFSAALRQIAHELQEAPSIQSQACDYTVSQLPVFVYMDEYQSFAGTALLDQVRQRRDRKQLQPNDKSLLTILALSGLDLDEQVEAAIQSGREQRQYDLSDAAATLTRKFASHWGPHHYELDFRADGQEFFTFVKAPTDKALIKLEERSRGFQWFFSFDLMFMHETKSTLEGCIILLDEPGLHLHPSAQRDLLERLQEYAKGNTLIYTTHLPFMIDVKEPARIRVLSETKKGTVVDADLTKSQPDAKLTLQAALGISGRQSYLVAERNLVVEGVHDYLFITELSNLLIRSGKQGLPEDVFITAAGGAMEATYIATFMIGQELGVVALYDSDREGNAAKDKLVKNWLTRYTAARATVISVGEAMGIKSRECTIEDLFTQEYYLNHVQELYGKSMAAQQIEKISLPCGGPLVRRVAEALKALQPKFNKGSVAKRICADIRKMSNASNLLSDVVKRAEALMKAITKAMPTAKG